MSALDQIVYLLPSGTGGEPRPAATSLLDRREADRWANLLGPWLRAGAPPGRGYLTVGSRAALIRWKGDAAQGLFAHALVGPAATLTAHYALLLPEYPYDLRLVRTGRLPKAPDTAPSPAQGIEARARSSGSIELLVPLLSRVLADEQTEQQVIVPWPAPLLPEAVTWGLVSILAMLGDPRPISFLTHAVGQPPAPAGPPRTLPAPAGLSIAFSRDAPKPRPDPRFEPAAISLATGYADGPAQLRLTLLQHGIPRAADQTSRLARLLDLWPPATPTTPVTPTPTATPGGTHTVNAQTSGPANVVLCPICLHEIQDWNQLTHWRWDGVQNKYAEVTIPHGASRQLINRLQRGTVVKCPDPYHVMEGEHYLPSDYGRFGPPVVLGFIGMTTSGKSHLLTAMVGEMERGGLREYGIDSRPIDHGLHKRFLDDWVRPLMTEGKVLPGTEEGIVTFADAFLVTPQAGPDRPVALFDVAGGELTKVEDTKQFLDIADGLFFVVDPAQMNADGLGDDTFNTVLNLVKSTGRLPGQVSAAIVLNKADMVRFEDPVALWLRADTKVLDAGEFLRESADVYAFLYEKGAAAWTRPYHDCAKATLHVASPTGGAGQRGGVYPRGVTPRRVLRPLVAMLAMTGVLTGSEAEKVGV